MYTGTIRLGAILASVWLGLSGCQEEREDVSQAVEAAKALSELGEQAERATAAADKAVAQAEKAAREQIPEGTDPEMAEQQVEMAKSLAALQAMSATAGGGPVVNWRKLAPLLADALGDLKAAGELDGSTNKIGQGLQVSQVKRKYNWGSSGRTVQIEITDASSAPFLRAPFAMAALIDEDSTRGYKKGKKLSGYPAVVEWRKAGARSQATVMVAERFVVDVNVRDAGQPEDAEAVLPKLDLNSLVKLKGESD